MTDLDATTPGVELALADWRRRVATLYSDVRFLYRDDPVAAWHRWREERASLYREHPSSPVPAAERGTFQPLHWGYDQRFAFEAALIPEPQPDPEAAPGPSLALPNSGPEALSIRRIGSIELPLPGGPARLAAFWMAGYVGGLFVPFRDATNGTETYGAGRYLIDAAKSADLGGDPERGTIVCDFNFSYQPSCAFDPKWACPLAPPENRLAAPIRAGERIA
ncbi:MAG: DUF1684 domain-containing protein [Chloroflexi bacterium]|nr:DUF1684 domain-containing protein [Chloroflexota bacterium]